MLAHDPTRHLLLTVIIQETYPIPKRKQSAFAYASGSDNSLLSLVSTIRLEHDSETKVGSGSSVLFDTILSQQLILVESLKGKRLSVVELPAAKVHAVIGFLHRALQR